MIYENDKLNIPEEYRKMTASELRSEREKLYRELKESTNQNLKKTAVLKRKTITFKF